jgi:hypothetical protein
MVSGLSEERDVSYIRDMASLVVQMAKGRFTTQPEIARAMISLRSYLLRVRRDFETDDFVRKQVIDKFLQIPPGALTPEMFSELGRRYVPIMREFLQRTGQAEMDTMG